MKKYVPFLLFIMCGCGIVTPYIIKKYDTNEVREVPMGTVMMSWEYGKYNSSAHYKFEGHRIELVYSGRVNNTVHITFQEFYVDDRLGAAPELTYTKVYTYDLNSSTVISYEDVRIHVIATTAATIRYRVTRGPKKFEEYSKDARQLYY